VVVAVVVAVHTDKSISLDSAVEVVAAVECSI
jgi:hypothetical protein